MQQGYWFARPMAALRTSRHGGRLGPAVSFLAVSPRSVLVSAVKRAEDGSGDLIVRTYNVLNTPAETSLRAFFPVAEASTTNLAEDASEPRPLDPDGTVHFTAGAHQIMTIRLRPADEWRSEGADSPGSQRSRR